MSDIAPWTFLHGASWLTEGGVVLPVPGFHETWIKEHAALVPGCKNVCDVILSKRWIAVGIYSEGYVELLIPGQRESDILERARRFLADNAGKWTSALFLSMDEEGYVRVMPQDVEAEDGFLSKFPAATGAR